MQTVLITGGTGMIGTRMTARLLQNGFQVIHLSRKPNLRATVKQFEANYKTHIIDLESLRQADYIINLAGAGIADHRWTKAYKKEIYNSRIQSTRLLVEGLKQTEHYVKKIIQISAVGIYRQNHAEPRNENIPTGNDFLAQTCMDWENELTQHVPSSIQTALFRTGLVLSPDGGFLQPIKLPTRILGGVYFGNGRQMQSWIHIDDLCGMMLKAITDSSLSGVYNAVSPQPLDQKSLMRQISRAMHRRLWLPPVPAGLLHLLLGEMASELLASHALLPERMLRSGFAFQFPELDAALKNLFPDKKSKHAAFNAT